MTREAGKKMDYNLQRRGDLPVHTRHIWSWLCSICMRGGPAMRSLISHMFAWLSGAVLSPFLDDDTTHGCLVLDQSVAWSCSRRLLAVLAMSWFWGEREVETGEGECLAIYR